MYPNSEILCPYCGGPTEFINGETLYGRKHKASRKVARNIYCICFVCDAYALCFYNEKRSDDPTNFQLAGTIANATLRKKRQEAAIHSAKIWRLYKTMDEYETLMWLSEELGIPYESFSIGSFDDILCDKVILLCQLYRQAYRMCVRELKEEEECAKRDKDTRI